jgi:hypothetical protein
MAKQVDYIKSRSTGFYTGITLLQQLNDLLDAQKNFAAGKGEKGPGARTYADIQRQILEIMNAINKYLIGVDRNAARPEFLRFVVLLAGIDVDFDQRHAIDGGLP